MPNFKWIKKRKTAEEKFADRLYKELFADDKPRQPLRKTVRRVSLAIFPFDHYQACIKCGHPHIEKEFRMKDIRRSLEYDIDWAIYPAHIRCTCAGCGYRWPEYTRDAAVSCPQCGSTPWRSHKQHCATCGIPIEPQCEDPDTL